MSVRRESLEITKMLEARARVLKARWVEGDATIRKQLASEFAEFFRQMDPDKSEGAIYQKICYYLRGGKSESNATTKAYAPGVIARVSCLSTAERKEFAEATGRTIRAVDAAVERYVAKNRATELLKSDEDVIAESDRAGGILDFSSFADMRYIGKSRTDVKKARKALSDRYGLSLRAPNFLYHAPTKKRYALSIIEQMELLDDPLKFIQSRVGHIKNNWVVMGDL